MYRFIIYLFLRKIYDTSKPTNSVLDAMSIQDRNNYMHMLLADPATGQIPKGIRSAELEFASTLPKDTSLMKIHMLRFKLVKIGILLDQQILGAEPEH